MKKITISAILGVWVILLLIVLIEHSRTTARLLPLITIIGIVFLFWISTSQFKSAEDPKQTNNETKQDKEQNNNESH